MNLGQQNVSDVINAVAAKQPTPGGGAVAAIVAALAAALGQMVLRYSIGKKSLIAHDTSNQQSLEKLCELTDRAMQLADEDAVAYKRLNALWKLDKTDPRREVEFKPAVYQAINAPHALMQTCLETLRVLQALPGTTNTMLASDLVIAAHLAEAGARAASWNVKINLPLLDDVPMRDRLLASLELSLADARTIAYAIESACVPVIEHGTA